jgi:hypothetical protein
MKYLFDAYDLPHEYKVWIKEQRKVIYDLVEAKKRTALTRLEHEYLEQWNYWKNRIDELDKVRKPNIREEILVCRFKLTGYDEALRYIHEVSPYKKKTRFKASV